MNNWDHISTDPRICHGKPCIKGTRILVSVILGALAGGASFDEIIEEYPPVTEEDIRWSQGEESMRRFWRRRR